MLQGLKRWRIFAWIEPCKKKMKFDIFAVNIQTKKHLLLCFMTHKRP
ncbi:hypothetical protein HMPREF1991_01848 [Hoylesella loescheii DSM 19665 = JCM 12249 = ATCC 15930]|uniref:Uncharacterized protein n=1 Tax=Hoylesella loescheii DSM 19665 = JCM 12249 = ATCC 15930 TaxID=1122985 RepID=A0A069QGU1_HOYLO|nr:hypothetical protein HMPREF1991_01848 [Hoylesella loescheii DSM 19665 = JCM 12249 = ATCC 15930]